MAVEALSMAHSMVSESTPPHRLAELAFVEGIVCFCQAEAISAGYLDVPQEAGSPEFMRKDLLVTALSEFEKAYAQWCNAYGEKHLQTVKAITMIGLLQSKVNGKTRNPKPLTLNPSPEQGQRQRAWHACLCR